MLNFIIIFFCRFLLFWILFPVLWHVCTLVPMDTETELVTKAPELVWIWQELFQGGHIPGFASFTLVTLDFWVDLWTSESAISRIFSAVILSGLVGLAFGVVIMGIMWLITGSVSWVVFGLPVCLIMGVVAGLVLESDRPRSSYSNTPPI